MFHFQEVGTEFFPTCLNLILVTFQFPNSSSNNLNPGSLFLCLEMEVSGELQATRGSDYLTPLNVVQFILHSHCSVSSSTCKDMPCWTLLTLTLYLVVTIPYIYVTVSNTFFNLLIIVSSDNQHLCIEYHYFFCIDEKSVVEKVRSCTYVFILQRACAFFAVVCLFKIIATGHRI